MLYSLSRLAALLALLAVAAAEISEHLVSKLPGFKGPLPSRHFSGYIPVRCSRSCGCIAVRCHVFDWLDRCCLCCCCFRWASCRSRRASCTTGSSRARTTPPTTPSCSGSTEVRRSQRLFACCWFDALSFGCVLVAGPGSSSLIGLLTENGQILTGDSSFAEPVDGVPQVFYNPYGMWETCRVSFGVRRRRQ